MADEIDDPNTVGRLWLALVGLTIGCRMHSRHDGRRGCFVTADVPAGPGQSVLSSKLFEADCYSAALAYAGDWARATPPTTQTPQE